MEVFKKNFWKTSVKFFFVPVNARNIKTFSGKLLKTTNCVAWNCVVVSFDKRLQVFSSNLFSKSFYEVDDRFQNSSAFPYKLKEMNGYEMKIIVGKQVARMVSRNRRGTYEGVDLAVMDIVARIHNATIKQIDIQARNRDWSQDMLSYLHEGKAEMSLLTNFEAIKLEPYWRTINTYDENGYCALVLIPERLTFLHYILEPFDVYSWILMFMVVAPSALIWKLVRRTDSNTTFSFVYGVTVSFFGQSIPFNRNNRMQSAILQLCFLMTFIMGSAYESLIIASMSYSRDGKRMKSFDELFASGQQLSVASALLEQLKMSNESKLLKNMMTIYQNSKLPAALQMKTVISRCDALNFMYSSNGWAKSFYLLPDIIMTNYETFMLKMFSPFHGLLKYYFDHIFESGIRQHLKETLKLSRKEAEAAREVDYHETDNEKLLALKDVSGIFYILLAGNVVASVLFLFEVFFNPSMNLLRRIQRRRLISRFLKTCMRRMSTLIQNTVGRFF